MNLLFVYLCSHLCLSESTLRPPLFGSLCCLPESAIRLPVFGGSLLVLVYICIMGLAISLRPFICISLLAFGILDIPIMFFFCRDHCMELNRLLRPGFKGSDTAYLLLYVDDIVLTAFSSTLLHQVIASLHAENILLRFLSVLICSLVTLVGLQLTQTQNFAADGDPVSDPTLYRSLAGALQYLTFTRPDISYVVQQVCLFMHDSREPHFFALKRILRYVRGTLDYGLQFIPPRHHLWWHTPMQIGLVVLLHAGLLQVIVFFLATIFSWSSKLQFTLSRSSAEAEYRGVANAVAETCWLHNLLRELYTPLSAATIVYCDNVSVVYLSFNPMQHQCTKHIEIDIYFVRNLVTTGHVRVLHVPSRYQFAYIFTKGLPTALFDEFRSSLSVRSSPAQTERGC
ncbi:ribonuclease H-like domain-containing protein [Tanacetum coccineum]